LILISPAGVGAEPEEIRRARQERASYTGKLFRTFYTNIFFPFFSAGNILRTFPSWSEAKFLEYVERRLPAIADTEERVAISRYLYLNSALPGSAEHSLSRLLTPYAFGRSPTEFRIPHLRIPHVSFLYGETDWMDANGGLSVQLRCENQPTGEAPTVDVYQVSNAGHLLMLENWEEFNTGMVLSAGLQPAEKDGSLPTKLSAARPPDVRNEMAKQSRVATEQQFST